jgi:ADP-ribosylglycohydrolase
MPDRRDTLEGVILGTAVGDALGLPREGLSPGRARALFGDPPLRHCFLFGHGMTSDDTEHTCLVAQALLSHGDDVERFSRALAWGLRGWIATIPVGVGLATLRACVKLWLGFSPARSGVYSAGNGPAMRAALFGVLFGHDRDQLRAFVRASTRLTHTDPRAERGALLVALAAAHGRTGIEPGRFVNEARSIIEDDSDLTSRLNEIEAHLARQASVAEFAQALKLSRGVTGYIYHTVPVVLYAWLRWPGEFRRPIEEVIALGGDTDTTGAILGALAGATCGASAIPAEWLRLCEWPRSVSWMRRVAARLAEGSRQAVPWFWPGVMLRNLLFFVVVLVHVVRRLFPPYRC